MGIRKKQTNSSSPGDLKINMDANNFTLDHVKQYPQKREERNLWPKK